MTHRTLTASLFAFALSGLIPAQTFAQSPGDMAARFTTLGIKAGSSAPTAETVNNILAISLAPTAAKLLVDGDCELMGKLPKLKNFSVSSAQISAICLGHIAKAPALASIGISNSSLDDLALSALANAKSLSSVTLSGSRGFTAKGIASLAALPSLKKLGLDSKEITDSTIAQIESLSALEELNLSGSGVADEGMKQVALLPALTELTMRGTPVSDNGLKNLATGSKKLQKLILSHSKNLTAAGLIAVSQLPALQELDLWTCKLGGGFEGLSKSTTLRNLTISGSNASDQDLLHLANMKDLVRLVAFDNPGITDKGLVALGKLPALKELNLSKTAVTDVGMQALANTSSLEILNLPDTSVGDGGVAALSGLKLKAIDLRATKVSDTGLLRLAEMPSLKSINVMQTAVTADAVTKAKSKLPGTSISK